MNNLKIYEEYNKLPIIGDYVVVHCESTNDKFSNYINNNIGKLNYFSIITDFIWVEYFNIPEDLKKYFDDEKYAILNTDNIKYFSKYKKKMLKYI